MNGPGIVISQAEAQRIADFHAELGEALDVDWRTTVYLGHYVARADIGGIGVEVSLTPVGDDGHEWWAVTVDGTISATADELQQALDECRGKVASWSARASGALQERRLTIDTGQAGLAELGGKA